MTKSKTRIEYDSMGPVELPIDVLYGPQTQRAINNFTISAEPFPWAFIKALIIIKLAAASTNLQLGLLSESVAESIINTCSTLLKGKNLDQFPVPVFQTGSGTSTNMNVNEVIARLAADDNLDISPNDHVNLGQSSNDVIPSAIQVSTSREISFLLIPAVTKLATAIRDKAREYDQVVKTGRTHLMDALPIRLGAEFEAWAVQLDEGCERLSGCLERLTRLPLGGTAIGSGINCHPLFPDLAIAEISRHTKIDFHAASSRYKGISSMDTALEASSLMKTLAASLMKIANDLRWMNSGPLAGLGEIALPALQPGSSIMPAKVNPVIPEAVLMACAQVTGYDCAITIAAQSGNFQLNTMLPLIGSNLLIQTTLLAGCCDSLAEKAFKELTVNRERCVSALDRNPILVTALNPHIGYLRAAELAKIAASEGKTILEVAKDNTDLPEETLNRLLDPKNLADGGNES